MCSVVKGLCRARSTPDDLLLSGARAHPASTIVHPNCLNEPISNPTGAKKKGVPVRESPAHAKDAGPASGAFRAARSVPRRHFERLAQRFIVSGMPRIRLSEGKMALSAHVSGWNCFHSGVSRRIKEKKSSLCGPYFFVSLKS